MTVRWGGDLVARHRGNRAGDGTARNSNDCRQRQKQGELLLGSGQQGKARSRADAAAGCYKPVFRLEEKATGDAANIGRVTSATCARQGLLSLIGHLES